MKTKKIELTLRKLNKLFDTVKSQNGKLEGMERDLMLGYLREIYDDVLFEEEKTPEIKETSYSEEAMKEAIEKAKQEARVKATLELKAKENEIRALAEREAERKLQAKLADDRRKVLEKEREALEAKMAAPVLEDPPVMETKAPTVEFVPPQPVKPAPQPAQKVKVFDEDIEALFEKSQSNELSQKLSSSPLVNIKRAISINDKLLYINELFNKNTAMFDEVLTKLNNLNNLDEAKAYLVEHVIQVNNWTSNSRKERAQKFIELVRRRYL